MQKNIIKTPKVLKRPIDKVKLLETIVALVFIGIIITLLFGFFPFSTGYFNQKAKDFFKSAGADSCSLNKVAVTPWRGISVTGIELIKVFPDGHRHDIKIKELTLSFNVIDFIISLRKGNQSQLYDRDLFAFTPEHPTLAIRHSVSFLLRFPKLKKIVLTGGTISVKQDTTKSLQIDNLYLHVDGQNEKSKEVEITGWFGADSIKWPLKPDMDNVKGFFTADEDRIRFDRCKGKMIDGRFKGEVVIDLMEDQIAHGECLLTDINLAKCYEHVGDNVGTIDGLANVNFELFRSALHVDSIRGRGVIVANRMTVSNVPMQLSLAMMLSIPQFNVLQFKKFKTNFEIRDGNVFTTHVDGTGDQLSIKADGWIQSTGALNEVVEGLITKKFSDALPNLIKTSLEPTKDGGRKFNFRVYGTFADPKVQLDNKTINRAVGSVFESVRDGLKDIFK